MIRCLSSEGDGSSEADPSVCQLPRKMICSLPLEGTLAPSYAGYAAGFVARWFLSWLCRPLAPQLAPLPFGSATSSLVGSVARWLRCLLAPIYVLCVLPHDEKRNKEMERTHLGGRNRRLVTERGRVAVDDISAAAGVASEEDAWCQLSNKLRARVCTSLLKRSR
ncbi:uncharacterized protein G2W53_017821 [Senna tora]|uniref:Uncharacterized protein n=1 Tax=Senna tora TaxID=362788 RepID=A0A834WKU0_9FABA|nr:uncharacterized protein G2W53_017821 [Senna tora]